MTNRFSSLLEKIGRTCYCHIRRKDHRFISQAYQSSIWCHRYFCCDRCVHKTIMLRWKHPSFPLWFKHCFKRVASILCTQYVITWKSFRVHIPQNIHETHFCLSESAIVLYDSYSTYDPHESYCMTHTVRTTRSMFSFLFECVAVILHDSYSMHNPVHVCIYQCLRNERLKDSTWGTARPLNFETNAYCILFLWARCRKEHWHILLPWCAHQYFFLYPIHRHGHPETFLSSPCQVMYIGLKYPK